LETKFFFDPSFICENGMCEIYADLLFILKAKSKGTVKNEGA